MSVKHEAVGGVRRVACDVINLVTGERFVGTVEALLDAEAYCDVEGVAIARITRAALRRMVDDGDHELVVALYSMYGGERPRPDPWWTHRDCLDDLWPLATRAEPVMRSADLRRVTALEAAHAILDRVTNEPKEKAQHRAHLISLVKLDCEHLLRRAGEAYLAAKAAVKRSRTR
jgi:hypothetical protein